MSHQIPTFEPFEPRLLMSGTPTVDSLFASAEMLDINPGTTVSADGQLDASDAKVMYQFTTKATGTIGLSMAASDGGLDTYLKLYDSYGRLLATNDNQGELTDSLISRYVYAGQTFFVEASGADGSQGDYSLSLTSNPVDDIGNTVASGKSMYVYATGTGTFTGMLNYSGDQDFVEYTATETGRATVRLYSYARSDSITIGVYDDQGVAQDVQLSQDGAWLKATFMVTDGQSSYMCISDSEGVTGRYYGQVLATVAQEFVDASDVSVLGANQQSETGTLAAGESDMYTFTAQANGYFQIDMTSADGDSYLQVYNDKTRLYYTNDNASYGTEDSRLRIYVREGQTFYVRASMADGTAGDYGITFTGQPYDDMANAAAQAAAMYTYTTGAATKYGNVDYNSDADVMGYTVRDSGLVRASLSSYYGSLAGVVSVYDADGDLVTTQTAGAGGSADIQFVAVAGEQYFFQVEGAEGSTGRYILKVLPTLWQEFMDADSVEVHSAQSETVSGTLANGEKNTYRITVPATGYYELNMNAADGSNADCYLEVFNDSQRRVAYNDNGSYYGGGDSKIRLYVREGEVLYIRATTTDDTAGDYTLTFESQPFDDAGNDAARAAALYVSPNGSLTKYGRIQYSDDVDCFAYTAKYTGLAQTTVTAYGYRSDLAATLTVTDADGDEVGSATAGAGGSLNLNFTVQEGETYYFHVSGDGSGLGMYNLKVLPTIWQEFMEATDVDVAGGGSATLNGTLAAGGSTAYKITAPASGYYQINMDAANGSDIDCYLEVYTESQTRRAYNDNASYYGGGDSQVRLYVREGQEFFVRASAAGDTAGDFTITFESQPYDDAGNDAARAAAMYVYTTGAVTKYGNIQYSDDTDCFEYTAKYDGLVQTTVAAYGYRSNLAATLTVTDANGNQVGTATAAAGGSLDLNFTSQAGETYYFSVAGDGVGLGMYTMKILPTVWQEFIEATDVNIDGAESATMAGTLTAGESKAYKITAPASGYYQINMDAANGSDIDCYLEVYTESQTRRAYNDNASYYGDGDSQVRLYVREGQEFFVRASAAGDTAGDFTITFESQPYDDAGNDAARATALYVYTTGAATKYGNIQYSNDTDCFEYAAKYSGLVQTVVSAYGYRSSLAATLTVRDANGNVMGTATAAEGGSLNLNFTATEGEKYYFSVAGDGVGLGMYTMKIQPTVWQDFIDATDVNVLGGDYEETSGTLAADGKVTYKITAPANGYFEVNLGAADGSTVDTYLEVFNDSQRRVAYSDNVSASSTDSRVRVYVREGQTYFVRASAANGTSGDFAISFESQPYDDAGNRAERAATLYVATNGSVTKYGNIQYANDTDCYSYTAKATGLVQIDLATYGYYSHVQPQLSVQDADGNELASETAGTNGALTLSFTATEGETYFLNVSGADDNLGMYRMKILPTIWQDFIDATEVDVPSAASVTETGTLSAGEHKTYVVTAAANGYMQFDMGADGSSLDSYIEIYTQDQRRLTYNDNVTHATTDSRARINVTEGQQLYVRVSGARDTAGDFSLTLTSQPTDDYGNSMAAAKAMAMAASGSSSALGEIQYDNDVDFFKFTATVTGDMTVGMNNSGVSDLIGSVRAIDANGTQLATDDGTDNSVRISFHVTAGQTYYLSAGSISGTAGRYVLGLATQADPIPDPTPDPEPTPDPDPIPTPDPEAPTPGASVAASVVTSGGTTRLVIAGTDNNDVITLTYDGSSTRVLVNGSTYRTFTGMFGYVSLYGFGGNDVITLDHSLTGETTVYAGDGADTVYENSQGAATLYGGAGDDLLISVGGGNDVVYGESGTDSFWMDTTDTLSDVSATETAAMNVHKIASFYQPYTTNSASTDYVSKEIDGQNMRDPACGATVYNYANYALFTDGPEYNDIRQGNLGDCYYLATMASLSDTDPNVIRQAVTSLGDGTFAVRYFRHGSEVYLRVDADMPSSYARLTPDNEVWVMVMEKAYAFFRYGQNSYSSIEGGWMSTVVQELSGHSATTLWAGGSASSLATTIANALAAGHSITLGSITSPASPIVGNHAYMLKSIEGSGAEAMVTVYNPWGVDGRSYDNNYNDGLLQLSMSQIQACFSSLVVAQV